MAHFCLLLFMGNHFLLRQQLVIVIVAKIRLLRNSEVHVSELKLREVLWSRSLRTPYLAKFDDPIFLQPPNVVDGIFNVSLRSQKVWWVHKIVRTRNGIMLSDYFAFKQNSRSANRPLPSLPADYRRVIRYFSLTYRYSGQ